MPRYFGLDVARHGTAETVLAERLVSVTRSRIGPLAVTHGFDTVEVANWAADIVMSRGPVLPDKLFIDAIGVGAGVADMLSSLDQFRTLRQHVIVIPINVGLASTDPDKRFFNLRSELFWAWRTDLEHHQCSLPDDEVLQQQMIGIRWRLTPTGQIQVESKEEIERRRQPSPDRADGIMLSYAEGRVEIGGGVGTFTVLGTNRRDAVGAR